jgi:hypothetical protein
VQSLLLAGARVHLGPKKAVLTIGFLKKLAGFALNPSSTQIGTQSLFQAGHDQSIPDTESDESELLEMPLNK